MNDSLFNQLNPEQLQVVKEGDGPVLVLAGAGSGKTRTITHRVVWLLEQGVLPQEILLLTFTNKAAKEMLSRVASLLGGDIHNLWGGTFHSIANRLLRYYANELAYTSNFTILDQDDGQTLIKACVKDLHIDTTAKRFPSASKIGAILSYARNANQSIAKVLEERFGNLIENTSVIERIAQLYTERKRQSNSMDFDDLLLHLRNLLLENPVVRDRLSTQFHYILVDEYQDTNVIQADIVKLLSGVHKNILVVGDDAQSIYSFRAAQIKNILQFPQMYPGTKTFRLTKNYRSSPEILHVANSSIENNVDQFKKELQAVQQSFVKPSLAPAGNAGQEAEYIAENILRIHKKGTPLTQIAVLFRAAFHSQALEFELMKRDIPYEYRGGLKFFERAHIKDVISHLRIKANVKDEAAWLRVLSLQVGVGLTTAQAIFARVTSPLQRGSLRGSEGNELAEICASEMRLPKRAASGWSLLHTTLQKLSTESHPADLIRAVISGEYRSYLEAEYQDSMERLEDLEQFALFAEQTKDLTTFLDQVSLTDEYGSVRDQENNLQQDRLILSTIHQAKGLEWDVVFVMHLADGKFPNPRALEEAGGIEEERRLFYVATTRARKNLFFTYPLTSGYDTLLLQQPSLFLQELPEELFEHERMKPLARSFNSTSFEEEPMIVLNDLGEEDKTRPSVKGMSFLRSVDEL